MADGEEIEPIKVKTKANQLSNKGGTCIPSSTANGERYLVSSNRAVQTGLRDSSIDSWRWIMDQWAHIT